ncbi:MAG TPA: hypothetical protein VM305_08470 [Candidatus Limnocylindrales bacterium]|nr:hypothetical protein [Candidatus Limnocylindrales bacterium]
MKELESVPGEALPPLPDSAYPEGSVALDEATDDRQGPAETTRPLGGGCCDEEAK